MAEIINISDLQQDTRNANKGTERGQLAVNNSLTTSGAGRSILIDKDGKIIAGNKTAKGAAVAGIENVRIIRTDGTELVAVMREDLDINDPEARRLAIADNRTAQLGLEWDAAELAAALDDGIDLGGLFDDRELDIAMEVLPDVDFDQFFEADNEPREDMDTIALKYTAADAELVRAAFAAQDGTKEQIVWRALGLNE